MAQEFVSTTVTVTVAIERMFTALADPLTHASIDGTGRVQEPVDQAPLTTVGQIFRMNMYHPDHPNGNYQTANKVHVFEAPSTIGWYTGHDPNGDGQLEFGGWFWRYDLVPAGPDATEVTLIYDWSEVPQHIREYISFPPFSDEHFANSIRHLGELAAAR